MAENTDILRCPTCGSRDVRRSHSRGLLDAIQAGFHRYPMRCRQCQRRFYLYQSQVEDEPPPDSPPKDE